MFVRRTTYNVMKRRLKEEIDHQVINFLAADRKLAVARAALADILESLPARSSAATRKIEELVKEALENTSEGA